MIGLIMIAACGTNDLAFERLEEANTAMNQIEGMQIDFTVETSMPIPESEHQMDGVTTGMIEVMSMNSESFEARIEVVQNLMGDSEIEYVGYFRDSILYIDLTEEWDTGFNLPLHPTGILSLVNIDLYFSEDEILDQSVRTYEGYTQLVFSLNDEALLQVINAQLRSHPDFDPAQLNEYTYELVVTLNDDNTIQTVEVDIAFTRGAADEEDEVTMRGTFTLVEDANITFEFPDHLDDFSGMEEGVMGIPMF